jgi:hypothetical protein
MGPANLAHGTSELRLVEPVVRELYAQIRQDMLSLSLESAANAQQAKRPLTRGTALDHRLYRHALGVKFGMALDAPLPHLLLHVYLIK